MHRIKELISITQSKSALSLSAGQRSYIYIYDGYCVLSWPLRCALPLPLLQCKSARPEKPIYRRTTAVCIEPARARAYIVVAHRCAQKTRDSKREKYVIRLPSEKSVKFHPRAQEYNGKASESIDVSVCTCIRLYTYTRTYIHCAFQVDNARATGFFFPMHLLKLHLPRLNGASC